MSGRYSKSSKFPEVLIRNVGFFKEKIVVGFDHALDELETAESIHVQDFDKATTLRITVLSELITELQNNVTKLQEELTEVKKR